LADTAELKMTATSLRLFFAIMVAAIVIACGGSPLRAQTVAVMVNGEPITNYDIEQRSKLMELSSHKAASRQEVLDELINEKVKIKEAKKYSVDPGVGEIDAAYNNMGARMRLAPDQLTQSLASKGIRPDTLKARLRAEMVWNAIVRGRFKESMQVGEPEVQAALRAQGVEKEADSFEYQMRPIVLIVPKGSPQSLLEARHKEAEGLRERIQTCEEANATLNSMQNSTIRATVTKTSADMPQALRDLLDKTPIGHLTPPEVTRQGIEMVALCVRKPSTVDTPKKREIRDKLFAQKFDAKSKSYLQEVRKAAMIEIR
jgi:peptidyl-prolyl cis-trans isomerase SurA